MSLGTVTVSEKAAEMDSDDVRKDLTAVSQDEQHVQRLLTLDQKLSFRAEQISSEVATSEQQEARYLKIKNHTNIISVSMYR